MNNQPCWDFACSYYRGKLSVIKNPAVDCIDKLQLQEKTQVYWAFGINIKVDGIQEFKSSVTLAQLWLIVGHILGKEGKNH